MTISRGSIQRERWKLHAVDDSKVVHDGSALEFLRPNHYVLSAPPGAMKALLDFISMSVTWKGVIPATPGTKETDLDAVEAMDRRHVRVVLEHIANRYPTRANQIERGLHLSRQDLANRLYSVRSVADALNILQRAGIVFRERQRGGLKGTEHEERARTHIHPSLIDQARAWDAERAQRYRSGLRGSSAHPQKTVVIPLVWNDYTGSPNASEGLNGAWVQSLQGAACKNCTHL